MWSYKLGPGYNTLFYPVNLRLVLLNIFTLNYLRGDPFPLLNCGLVWQWYSTGMARKQTNWSFFLSSHIGDWPHRSSTVQSRHVHTGHVHTHLLLCFQSFGQILPFYAFSPPTCFPTSQWPPPYIPATILPACTFQWFPGWPPPFTLDPPIISPHFRVIDSKCNLIVFSSPSHC